MAAAPPPHAAAATETRDRIPFRGKGAIYVTRNPSDDMCSMRLRGKLILSHGSRRFGPSGWFVDVTDLAITKLDHLIIVHNPSVFQVIEICSELIHGAIAEEAAAWEYDLAGVDWADRTYTPRPDDIATAINRFIGDELQEILDDAVSAVPMVRPVFPGYDVDIEIPQLRVSMVYTEPKELLLACKEPAADTVAARVSARRRKRRREPAGELCAICLLDFSETEEEEAVRLPCSHPFHSGCIEPWFRRAPTCPTCRRDIMQCFGFVR